MSKLEKMIVSHNNILTSALHMIKCLDQEDTDVQKFKAIFEAADRDTLQTRKASLETKAITTKSGDTYDKVVVHFPASPDVIGRKDLIARIDSINAQAQRREWYLYEPNGTYSANRNTENIIFGSELVDSYNKTVEGQVTDPVGV